MDLEIDLFGDDSEGLSEAELTQQLLRDSRERLGSVLEAMPVGLLIHSAQGILYSNPAGASLLCTTARTLCGQHFLDFVRPDQVQQVALVMTDVLSGTREGTDYECMLEPVNAQTRICSLTIGRLPWPGNPVAQILFRDITEQKRAEASLRQMSVTDELTGAYNRRHAAYEASLYIGDGSNPGLPFSVIMLDIDHFKSVNDNYGHAAGDAVLIALVATCQRVLATLSETDSAMLARLGGEEFLVLLPGVDAQSAVQIAERLRAAVAAILLPSVAPQLRITSSFGCATYRPSDGSYQALLERADVALYQAKADGRNRVVRA